MNYRLSVYKTRGTELVFDLGYQSKTLAFACFQRMAKQHITDKDVCVLLSRAIDNNRSVTIACKNTDAAHVELHLSFYGGEG